MNPFARHRLPSQAVPLEAAVEGAAAQAQGIRCVADIPVEPGESLLDEKGLHVFETHLFETRRTLAAAPQAQIHGTDRLALRHQDGALYGMVQLADIAGPGVPEQGLDSALVEPGQRL